MIKILGVQFKTGIKVYDFKQEEVVELGDLVLVDTIYGEEIGKVIYKDKEVDEKDSEDLKGVIYVLTDEDARSLKEAKKDHLSYYSAFKERIRHYGLDMKPVDFEFSLDQEKVTFYFTAENRVDFRDLVRDISKSFRKTVLLRQMGQRDEARFLDGFGSCGERICCKRFLVKMENITMDMVREQYEGSRNSSKVSGICGRLMCCLAYEEKIPKTEKKQKGIK